MISLRKFQGDNNREQNSEQKKEDSRFSHQGSYIVVNDYKLDLYINCVTCYQQITFSYQKLSKLSFLKLISKKQQEQIYKSPKQSQKMSYLDACICLKILIETLQRSIIGKSVLMAEPIRIQSTLDIENVPGIKMKGQQQFANAEVCNICKQPFNPQRNVNRHHCRICAVSVCGQCSRKKINKERSCDFCFLKQCLKKQQHERKQQFRLRQQNIERMNKQITQYEKEIQDLDKELVVIDKANIQLEVKNAKELSEKEEELKQRQQSVKQKQEEYEKRRKELVAKKEELESREDRNKIFSSKVQIIKLDISSKQSSLLQKMEELQRLKLQLQKLDSQKEQLLAEFK